MKIKKHVKSMSVAFIAGAFVLTGGLTAANASTLTSAPPAMPEIVDEDFFSGLSETTLSDSSGVDDGVGTLSITTNPYNCGGYTPYVHVSGGKVSGHADIKNCTGNPAYLEAIVGVYKEGWFNQWHFLGSNINTAANVNNMTTHFKRNCVTWTSQNYRSIGSYLVSIGGTHYTGNTASDPNRIICDAHAGPHQP